MAGRLPPKPVRSYKPSPGGPGTPGTPESDESYVMMDTVGSPSSPSRYTSVAQDSPPVARTTSMGRRDNGEYDRYGETSFPSQPVDAPNEDLKSTAARKPSKMTVAILVFLIGMYIVVSIFSTSLFIKMVIFDGGYDTPAKTNDAKAGALYGLIDKERALYPTINGTGGTCNDTMFNGANKEMQSIYYAQQSSAMIQVLNRLCVLNEINPTLCLPTNLNSTSVRNTTAYGNYVGVPTSSSVVAGPVQALQNALYQYRTEAVGYMVDYVTDVQQSLAFYTQTLSNLDFSVGGQIDISSQMNFPVLYNLIELSDNLRGSFTIPPKSVYYGILYQVLDFFRALDGRVVDLRDTIVHYVDSTSNVLDNLPQINAAAIDFDTPNVTSPYQANVTALNTTKPSLPNILISLDFPTIYFGLNCAIAIDTALVVFDVGLKIYQLRYNLPALFTVKRSVGTDLGDGNVVSNTKKKLRAFGQQASIFLQKAVIVASIITIYAIFLYLYSVVLYTPLKNPNSYIYRQEGYYFTFNSAYEFTAANEIAAKQTAAANACVGEQVGRAGYLQQQHTTLLYNISYLGIWAEQYWLDHYGVVYTFNSSLLPSYSYDSPPTEDLCTCHVAPFSFSYAPERAAAARAADAQGFKIASAYILKIHFFIALLIALRVIRTTLIQFVVETLVRYKPVRFEAIISMPADTNVVVTKKPSAKSEDIVDFSKEYEKYQKQRVRTVGLMIVADIVLVGVIVGVAAWNTEVNRELVS